MKEAGKEGSYRLFEMPTLPQGGLKQFMESNNLVGLNITIPYKEAVLDALDWIEDMAQSLGAVNTVILENGMLKGYNTDVYSIQKSLKPWIASPVKRWSWDRAAR